MKNKLHKRKLVYLSMGITCAFLATNAVADSLCKGYQTELFGPRVCIFDEGQSQGGIQPITTAIHDYEKNNQFGSDGYALLFKPGAYPALTVPVGYYTQVLGLGKSPDDTKINVVKVDADDLHGGTSLDDFWRSGENFAVNKDMVWAVSQASPLRRIHVAENLVLSLGGEHYASGGFLANSKVDKGIASSGQQQWLTRNTSMQQWYDHGVWNMVFVGSSNTPSDDNNPNVWQNYPNTVVAKTPRIQEKPYLSFDNASQSFQVVVPKLVASASANHNWQPESTIIPQSQFVIAKPGMSAAEINAALSKSNGAGPKALIFTPGQYNLNATINISVPNTVVLGIGVPVLTATTPHQSLFVTNAAGIKMGGFIVEAGSNESPNPADPALIEIGARGQDKGVANSPTTLSDLYCRVGGRIDAQTDTCLAINDSYVIGDNLWLWRADHDVKGSVNTWLRDQANHALIVRGKQVTMYGLFAEHFLQNQVIWEGEQGAVYFYQSELPYDMPTDTPVAASFKIDNAVKSFQGTGMGIYSYFRTNPGYAISAIETPNSAGIQFTHLVAVAIPGKAGEILNMIQVMPDKTLWKGNFISDGIARHSGQWTGINQ